MRRPPLEEGLRWLEQAEEDLKWAEDLARRGGYHIACFLAQQIAEKALKGFLYAQGDDVVLGHSVERLSAEAAGRDARFEPRRAEWALLDAYYIPTRYPNSVPDGIPARVYTAAAAEDATRMARDAVETVRSALVPPSEHAD